MRLKEGVFWPGSLLQELPSSLKRDTMRDCSPAIDLFGCDALMCYRHTALTLREANQRRGEERELQSS